MRRLLRRGPLLLILASALALLWLASFLVSARVRRESCAALAAGRWETNTGLFLQHGWIEFYRQSASGTAFTPLGTSWELTTVSKDFSIAGRWKFFRYEPPKSLLGDYTVDVAGITLRVEKRTLTAAGNITPGEITIFLPVLWPTVICAALATLLLYNPLQRKRLKHGLCVACGYDVRITPARCPECGQPNPLIPAPRISTSP